MQHFCRAMAGGGRIMSENELTKEFKLAVEFTSEFIKEFGAERSYAVIERVLKEKLTTEAKLSVAKLGGNSIKHITKYCEGLAQGDCEITVIESTDSYVAIIVRRCKVYEAFNELGFPEIGRLYCKADYAFTEAFNPEMKLLRTKMISNGDEFCNHIWADSIVDSGQLKHLDAGHR